MSMGKNDSHPARAAWAMYQETSEYAGEIKLHDEAALFAGFLDGWMYGRDRRERIEDQTNG